MFRAAGRTDGGRIEGRRVGLSGVICSRVYSGSSSSSGGRKLAVASTAMIKHKPVRPLVVRDPHLEPHATMSKIEAWALARGRKFRIDKSSRLRALGCLGNEIQTCNTDASDLSYPYSPWNIADDSDLLGESKCEMVRCIIYV